MGPSFGLYLNDHIIINSSLLFLPGASLAYTKLDLGNGTDWGESYGFHLRKSFNIDLLVNSFSFGLQFSSGKITYESERFYYTDTFGNYLYTNTQEKKNKTGKIDFKFGFKF